MAKLIIYSKTYGTKEVLFDDEFESIIKQYHWHLKNEGNGNFYAMTNIAKTAITMHRFLYPTYKIIDHKNGNGLDNRGYNLRNTDSNSNNKNKTTRMEWSSKFKGVTKIKENRFHAGISNNNEHFHLGTFKNELAAATAYNIKARELHGEFANCNKIEELNNYLDYRCELPKTSQYKNISYDKTRDRWLFQITINEKAIRSKRFKTEEEAHKALQELKETHGRKI